MQTAENEDKRKKTGSYVSRRWFLNFFYKSPVSDKFTPQRVKRTTGLSTILYYRTTFLAKDGLPENLYIRRSDVIEVSKNQAAMLKVYSEHEQRVS